MNDNFIVKVSGKNISLGNSFQNYNFEKLNTICHKYAAKITSCSTVLEKRNIFFKVKLNINIKNNIKFEAVGVSKIAEKALDIASINVSKRIRRYYRKIKKHRLNKTKFISVKQDLVKFHLVN